MAVQHVGSLADEKLPNVVGQAGPLNDNGATETPENVLFVFAILERRELYLRVGSHPMPS
jgi:hypothetical protein